MLAAIVEITLLNLKFFGSDLSDHIETSLNRKRTCSCHPLLVDHDLVRVESVFVPEILRARDYVKIMQIRERNGKAILFCFAAAFLVARSRFGPLCARRTCVTPGNETHRVLRKDRLLSV